MKRKAWFIILCFMTFVCCGKDKFKNPISLFSKIDIKQYEPEYVDFDTNLSEGAQYCVLRNNKKQVKEIFHVTMCSSSGQTQYYVFEDEKTKVRYVKKTAFFYEKPFSIDDAEIKDSYFCYQESVPYRYNTESGKYEKNVDINSELAVVDYRHLNELITDLTGL